MLLRAAVAAGFVSLGSGGARAEVEAAADWINLIVNLNDYETGEGALPKILRMQYGVWDPGGRMRGSITYLQGGIFGA